MKKRIEALDALRGFSLLGILVANMLYFQYGDRTIDTIQPTTWWDKGAFYFTKIVVEASFYPIFGFLFGYGIILFVRSLEIQDLKARGPLWRRAIGLMVLGGLHIAFVWDGDILLTYGAGLVVLLLFIKRKVKTLLIWAGVLMLIMLPILLVKTSLLALAATEMEKTIFVLANGTYWEVVQQRLNITEGIPIIFFLIALPFAIILLALLSFFTIGSFVLLGMAAAKSNFFVNISEKKVVLRRLVVLVPIGLVCKSLLYWDHFIGTLIYGAGSYILAIGYIALFVLTYLAMHESKLAQAFVSMGRLSLTNYLMQSVIFTTIFYGYAFGLFGELGVAIGLLLAIVVYAIQLYVSTLYTKRFSIGPVEWLLRKWVYLGDGRSK